MLTTPLPSPLSLSLSLQEAEDDDDATNRSSGLRRQQSRDQAATPTSHWNVDGDDLNRADIDVRYVYLLFIVNDSTCTSLVHSFLWLSLACVVA